MSTLPTKPGFYWAKWKIASDSTPHGDELTPSNEWEVVELIENSLDPSDEDHWMVSISGVLQTQNIEHFFWGENPKPLKAPNHAYPVGTHRY